jgi:hypothetical protein
MIPRLDYERSLRLGYRFCRVGDTLHSILTRLVAYLAVLIAVGLFPGQRCAILSAGARDGGIDVCHPIHPLMR